MTTVYQNKWCKIVASGTYYILQSKSGKYNDQYFTTLDAAKIAIGVLPTPLFRSDINKSAFVSSKFPS